MDGLDRRVAGDWYDIREAAKSYDTLETYFKIPPAQLKIQIEKLEFAVEQGIVEYKRGSLGPLYGMAEGARFRSPSLEEVRRQLDYTAALLFAMLIQRQLTDGTLRIAIEKKQDDTITADDLELGAVLRDVNERIKRSPEFAANPYVKNIQLQAVQLRRERESMQKLLPTIKPEALDTFQQNYRKTFAEIVDKIKRSYAALLKEENPTLDDAKPVLAAVSLSPLMPALTEQCQRVSAMRSTLLFASEEKYGTREIFVSLARSKDDVTRLLERESETCAKLQVQVERERISGERSITRAFCAEIVRVLRRAVSR